MIDRMTPCVAVMVMENGEEEVLRMKIAGLRQFTYVCPRNGAYRLYIVPDWNSDWRTEAIDDVGHDIGDRDGIRYYAPPTQRATWGDIA